MVRSETLTRHTYYTEIGHVEWTEESGTAVVGVNKAGVTPDQLREFAKVLNDTADSIDVR